MPVRGIQLRPAWMEIGKQQNNFNGAVIEKAIFGKKLYCLLAHIDLMNSHRPFGANTPYTQLVELAPSTSRLDLVELN